MVTIAFIEDYPEVIPALGIWFSQQWPDYFAGRSQEEMEQGFLSGASSDRLPIRLIAFDSGILAGTIVLREHVGESLPKYQPELGGLFVVERHRGRGIATQLVQAAMKLASDLGYKTIFAITIVAAGILERLGWEFIQTVVHQDGELSLYRCKL